MKQAAPTRTKVCPQCWARNATRSHRNLLERLPGLLRLFPYRCQRCHARFWRFG